jgi:hypothetical protein
MAIQARLPLALGAVSRSWLLSTALLRRYGLALTAKAAAVPEPAASAASSRYAWTATAS